MSDEDRIAYLAGDGGSVPPEDRAELDELRNLLGNPALWTEPASELEDRVAAAIAAEHTASGVVTSPPYPTTETMGRLRTSPRPARRWRAAAVGLAAAVLIAVGIAVPISRRDGHGEHFTIALSSPNAVSAVDGRAELIRTDSGWRIELDATGLPRLDNGRFYQAWMRNDAGSLVPIGTFNEGHTVVLWSGVSPRDYPTLTVTEEAANGDQESSGRRVLTGTLAVSG